MSEVCPRCDMIFKNVAQHWRASPECGHPEIPETMKRDIQLFYFSASVDKQSNAIQFQSTHLHKVAGWKRRLDWMAGSISPKRYYEDRRDAYTLRTRTHPWVTQLIENDGELP